jgi:hypothetical protein
VVDGAKTVTATFALSAPTAPTTYTLTLSKSGSGSGTVTSSPAGITCGSDCTQSYTSGTSVTLTATPATGSTFAGWSGTCTGTGTCTRTMTQDRSVTATFTATATPLAVTGVTANRTPPQPVGTAITFTATANGGTAPYQYKWWVWNGSTWTVGRSWATGNTYTWTPRASGSYIIQVWARNSGTTADTWEAWGQTAYSVR